MLAFCVFYGAARVTKTPAWTGTAGTTAAQIGAMKKIKTDAGEARRIVIEMLVQKETKAETGIGIEKGKGTAFEKEEEITTAIVLITITSTESIPIEESLTITTKGPASGRATESGPDTNKRTDTQLYFVLKSSIIVQWKLCCQLRKARI